MTTSFYALVARQHSGRIDDLQDQKIPPGRLLSKPSHRANEVRSTGLFGALADETVCGPIGISCTAIRSKTDKDTALRKQLLIAQIV